MEQIKFQIETTKIISLLSNDIYDSPYALLRENVQNAYDAILMRKQKEFGFTPKIDVVIDGKEITISDNGIGMTRDVVENNYWKAGSSGKNNEEARKAGVVGTFGIGAMANFGICDYLKVSTHYLNSGTTIISYVNRNELNVSENCINIQIQNEAIEPGTTIYATLDENSDLNEADAINYLRPYVQYLAVPVTLNGKIISQNEICSIKEAKNVINEFNEINDGNFRFNLKIQIQNYGNGQVIIYADNIYSGGNHIKGEISLEQDKNFIFGLRNNFGLAAIPINSFFNLGGIINLSVLQPTAGREALSRESVEFVSKIISIIENQLALILSKHDICDSNRLFLLYIQAKGKYDLAGKIKIQILPGEEFRHLAELSKQMDNKEVYFYTGNDKQLIEEFSNENTYLLLLSKENPRKSIQQKLIIDKGIKMVPNSPKIIKEYTIDDLSNAEFAFTIRILSTLKDDYLIGESKVFFAEISHQVPNMVVAKDDVVNVYLSRNSANIQQVLNIYNEERSLFDGFVKDYIRNYLYPKIAPYVPSTTKQGADALYRILQKNKELYTIESEDMGDLDSMIKDFYAGKIGFNEVIKVSGRHLKTHSQTVRSGQIGTVEQELSTIISHTPLENKYNIEPSIAIPPIRLFSNETKKKILKTDTQYPQLNNYTQFLALSDNVFNRQSDFFLEPHTTKVIWGMHKIVYIFTHASGRITMYYDIELKERLSSELTGGRPIKTTTIISKNRIFVPIIDELMPYFEIKQNSLSFYVRYDILSDLKAE